jgi:hypothetical protein
MIVSWLRFPDLALDIMRRGEADDLDDPPALALADGPGLDDPHDIADLAFFVFVVSKKCPLLFDGLFI